jgi:HSP20 family protein
VKLANGILTIRGEKRGEKEEEKKRRKEEKKKRRKEVITMCASAASAPSNVRFRCQKMLITDKVSASFKKGLLTVMLPKSAEAQKAEKKIEVKAG